MADMNERNGRACESALTSRRRCFAAVAGSGVSASRERGYLDLELGRHLWSKRRSVVVQRLCYCLYWETDLILPPGTDSCKVFGSAFATHWTLAKHRAVLR